MLYVVGSRIYGTTKNLQGVYPEILLWRRPDGSIEPEILTTGLTQKPTKREYCTWPEVLARFGASAQVKPQPIKAKTAR